MCDHHRRKVILLDNPVREGKDLLCSLRVECCRMLVKKQYFRLFERCHQKRQSLSLTAGEESHLDSHSVLESQFEGSEGIVVDFSLLSAYTPLKASFLPPAVSKSHVLLNEHIGCSSHHRVLKDTPQHQCSLIVGK